MSHNIIKEMYTVRFYYRKQLIFYTKSAANTFKALVKGTKRISRAVWYKKCGSLYN